MTRTIHNTGRCFSCKTEWVPLMQCFYFLFLFWELESFPKWTNGLFLQLRVLIRVWSVEINILTCIIWHRKCFNVAVVRHEWISCLHHFQFWDSWFFWFWFRFHETGKIFRHFVSTHPVHKHHKSYKNQKGNCQDRRNSPRIFHIFIFFVLDLSLTKQIWVKGTSCRRIIQSVIFRAKTYQKMIIKNIFFLYSVISYHYTGLIWEDKHFLSNSKKTTIHILLPTLCCILFPSKINVGI